MTSLVDPTIATRRKGPPVIDASGCGLVPLKTPGRFPSFLLRSLIDLKKHHSLRVHRYLPNRYIGEIGVGDPGKWQRLRVLVLSVGLHSADVPR